MIAEWVRTLVGVVLIFSFLDLLLPESDLRRFVRVMMGLVVVAVLLVPVGQLLRFEIPFDEAAVATQASSDAQTSWRQQAELIKKRGVEVVSQTTAKALASQVQGILQMVDGVERADVEVRHDENGRPDRVDIWLRLGAREEGVRVDAQKVIRRVESVLQSLYGLSKDILHIRVLSDGRSEE